MSHRLAVAAVLITAGLVAVALPAQAAGPAVALPATSAPCVAIGFVHEHADAAGVALAPDLARVLAEARCARAKAAAPRVAVSLHVDDDVTAVAIAAPAADAAALADFAAAFAAVPGSDDELACAIAAAALACDDARHVLPGGELAAAARAALCPQALAPAGAASLLALTPTAVRALAGAPRRTLAGVAGDERPELRALARAAERTDLPSRLAFGQAGAGSVAAELVDTVHRRVDQPFVAAAFAVPMDLDRAALAVALAVARDRAARRWQLRGSELRAGTPFVDWSWLRGDALVAFHRRGLPPVRLRPGEPAADAAAERDATAAELRELLADLRRPVDEREIAGARTQVVAEVGCQLRADASDPATVALALRQALLRAVRGIDAGAVAAVTPAAATAALARVLDAPACWRALLPTPSVALGWRPR
ncbi:MAG: hypothetical protein INH34_05755 [Phycisphaerales bacterium]|jgi:hypothetical protein|nr:hypothetical protein [Phycisphaerales bacterium]